MIAYIDMYKDRFGVRPICRTLGATEGGFITSRGYRAAKTRPISDREVRDRQLIPVLCEVHARNYGVYGKRKMWKAMVRDGWEIGRTRPFTTDNCFSSFTLLLESVTVSYCPFVAVLPHCAPRPGVCRIVWVPHWLSERNTAFRVRAGLTAFEGGGVNDLAIGSVAAVPVEVARQVLGCFSHPRSHNEPQPGFLDSIQIGG